MIGLALLSTLAQAEEDFAGNVYYLGDLHAHSGLSGDGGSSDLGETCQVDCGSFDDLFQVARSNGLDFAAVTDHINGASVTVSSDGFADLVALALAENDPSGGFVTLPAGEVWFSTPKGALGHKTLLFFGDDADLSDLTLDDVRPASGASTKVADCAAVWRWADGLQANWGNILTIPHHPALVMPMPTDWSCTDPVYEPVVEVYSEHGNSLGDGTGYDEPWSGTDVDGTVHAAIDPAGAALQLGFVGGTDKHNSRPGDVCNLDDEHPTHPYGGGLTIAVVPEGQSFDRAAIYGAFVEHRTLTTTGPLVPVDVRYRSGGVHLSGLGQGFALPVGQDLDVDVSVPAHLAAFVSQVEIVTPLSRYVATSDGAGGFQATVPAAEATGWAYAAVQIDGATWYGKPSCDDGGASAAEYIWTSPGYFVAGPDDLDGDGFAYLGGDCDDADPAVAPGRSDVVGDGLDQDCDGCDGVCGSMPASPGDGRFDKGLTDGVGADSADGSVSWGALGRWGASSHAPLPRRSVPTAGCATATGAPGLVGLIGLLALRRRTARRA